MDFISSSNYIQNEMRRNFMNSKNVYPICLTRLIDWIWWRRPFRHMCGLSVRRLQPVGSSDPAGSNNVSRDFRWSCFGKNSDNPLSSLKLTSSVCVSCWRKSYVPDTNLGYHCEKGGYRCRRLKPSIHIPCLRRNLQVIEKAAQSYDDIASVHARINIDLWRWRFI